MPFALFCFLNNSNQLLLQKRRHTNNNIVAKQSTFVDNGLSCHCHSPNDCSAWKRIRGRSTLRDNRRVAEQGNVADHAHVPPSTGNETICLSSGTTSWLAGGGVKYQIASDLHLEVYQDDQTIQNDSKRYNCTSSAHFGMAWGYGFCLHTGIENFCTCEWVDLRKS